MVPKERPDVLTGETIRIKTSCGTIIATLNSEGGALTETIVHFGKSGSCANSMLEAIGRLISLALRYEIPISEIEKQLKDLRCPNPLMGRGAKSCPDAIAKIILKYDKNHIESDEASQ